MNASPPAAPALFHPGDRWLAIGDSITQHAGYQAAVLLFYATRFPGRALSPANAGIVGDFVGGALARYDWDIAPSRATVATVMFGMNDVGQDLYTHETPSPEQIQRRHARLHDYRENLARLAGRLRRDGARVVLISPSIFDNTVPSDHPARPGIHSALAECAAIARRVAAKQGHAFVDLHTPMADLNRRLQSADPSATVVGPDRIHPGPAGHLFIAHQILQAQGAPALVSHVAIDASRMRPTAADNATVDRLSGSPADISFTVSAGALPYPVPHDASAAASWLPFHENLNRETLRIAGLAPGRYALLIDGVEVGRMATEDLGQGVNLALAPGTPQMRQAVEVADSIRRWQQVLSLNLRRVAMVEHWHLRHLPRPVRFPAAREVLVEKLASPASPDAYTRTALESYLAIKPNENAAREEIAALLSRIQAGSRPRPHEYRLTRLPGP